MLTIRGASIKSAVPTTIHPLVQQAFQKENPLLGLPFSNFAFDCFWKRQL